MLYIDQELKTHYQGLVQHAQLVTSKLLLSRLLDQRDLSICRGIWIPACAWNPDPGAVGIKPAEQVPGSGHVRKGQLRGCVEQGRVNVAMRF